MVLRLPNSRQGLGEMITICDGWTKKRHETYGELFWVIIPGCEYCGGSDCGDTGDALMMCGECAIDCINWPDWDNRKDGLGPYLSIKEKAA